MFGNHKPGDIEFQALFQYFFIGIVITRWDLMEMEQIDYVCNLIFQTKDLS